MSGTLALALAGAALLVFLSLALARFQRSQVFRPTRAQPPLTPTPADRDVPFEDVYFDSTDGLTLNGWFIPCPNATFTILICHGNAGNIADRVDTAVYYRRLGLNVFIFDYRGYGLSPGEPTEHGLYSDAQAAWDYLTRARSLDAQQLVILGRSLGGAVASHLAVHNTARAVIIESTFTSIPLIGRERYRSLPTWLFRSIRFDNIRRLERIEAPLLLVHSRDDEVIPFAHGEALRTVRGPRQLLVEIRGSHSGGYAASGDDYTAPLREFLLAAGVTLAPQAIKPGDDEPVAHDPDD